MSSCCYRAASVMKPRPLSDNRGGTSFVSPPSSHPFFLFIYFFFYCPGLIPSAYPLLPQPLLSSPFISLIILLLTFAHHPLLIFHFLFLNLISPFCGPFPCIRPPLLSSSFTLLFSLLNTKKTPPLFPLFLVKSQPFFPFQLLKKAYF